MAEENASAATKNTDPSPAPQPTPSASQAANTEKEETYTKDQMTRIVSQRLKEQKDAYEKQLADANKTELERAQSEANDLRARLAERESKDEVTALLSKNGCTRPEAAYRLIQSSITRGKDGKIEDVKALLAEAKELAPEFFPDSKKPGSADAGAKGDGKTGTDMNAWLRS